MRHRLPYEWDYPGSANGADGLRSGAGPSPISSRCRLGLLLPLDPSCPVVSGRVSASTGAKQPPCVRPTTVRPSRGEVWFRALVGGCARCAGRSRRRCGVEGPRRGDDPHLRLRGDRRRGRRRRGEHGTTRPHPRRVLLDERHGRARLARADFPRGGGHERARCRCRRRPAPTLLVGQPLPRRHGVFTIESPTAVPAE